MEYLEDALGNFRAPLYEDFRTIIHHCCVGNRLTVSPALTPFLWGDEKHESCMFACDAIEIDQYGDLSFYQGSFGLNASQIDTDNLVSMHDELIEEYDLEKFQPGFNSVIADLMAQ